MALDRIDVVAQGPGRTARLLAAGIARTGGETLGDVGAGVDALTFEVDVRRA